MTTPPLDLNGWVEPNAAKQILYQHLATFLPANSPQYFNAAQKVSQHVDDIVAGETTIALTGRRVAELAAASQTYLGPAPEQRATEIAQQRAREQGRAADLNELPPAFRADLDRRGGVTPEDVAELAHHVYRDLPRPEAVKKYVEVAKRTVANGISDYANTPMNLER